MNKRVAKAIRLGESLAVVLPKDWARGNMVRPGDELDIEYDGNVSISVCRRGEGNEQGDGTQ